MDYPAGKVHFDDQGNKFVVESGATLEIKAGATVTGLAAVVEQTALADLGGALTGVVNGALVDVAAAAGACAGGATPTAAQVDTAIATAVATIVLGVNEQNKELLTKINALLTKLRSADVIADA